VPIVRFFPVVALTGEGVGDGVVGCLEKIRVRESMNAQKIERLTSHHYLI